MPETLRQQIARTLTGEEYDFEELRQLYDMSVRRLADELEHVRRSVQGQGGRMEIRPPRCQDCGFDFPGRVPRHLHPPGRCPECRGRHLAPPTFRIVS